MVKISKITRDFILQARFMQKKVIVKFWVECPSHEQSAKVSQCSSHAFIKQEISIPRLHHPWEHFYQRDHIV